MANDEPTRTCVITGANRGIGLGIARVLDAAGYRLVLTVRSEAARDRLARELQTFSRRGHLTMTCDLAVPASVPDLFRQIDDEAGPIDGMVVNAGVHMIGPALEMGLDEWEHLFAVDVTSAMLCCREAATRMVRQRCGVIVLVGSIAGERPAAHRACYCAAKAAIHAYARSVSAEWAPQGVRINIVAPGPIDTGFLDEAAEKIGGRQALAQVVPLRRLGTPEDVGKAVAFLLSDQAAFITGGTLQVDGGRIWS